MSSIRISSVRWHRAGSVAALAALFALGGAGAAHANGTVSNGCGTFHVKQAFAKWADTKSYTLAPNGGFEQGTSGWALGGAASIVPGNEPFGLNDPADSASATVPAGSSITSPEICVGFQSPQFRLVARNLGGPLATLKVEVIYLDRGAAAPRVAGVLTGGPQWNATNKMSIASGQLGQGPVNRARIAIRITPQGGDWQVDDLFVDPRAYR